MLVLVLHCNIEGWSRILQFFVHTHRCFYFHIFIFTFLFSFWILVPGPFSSSFFFFCFFVLLLCFSHSGSCGLTEWVVVWQSRRRGVYSAGRAEVSVVSVIFCELMVSGRLHLERDGHVRMRVALGWG